MLDSEESRGITALSESLEETTTTHKQMMHAYEARIQDIKERYAKVCIYKIFFINLSIFIHSL